MKRLLSLLLTLAMIMSFVPLSLSVAEQTEPSTYWIDRDKQDGYLGNYTLISNEFADPASYLDIGNITSQTQPVETNTLRGDTAENYALTGDAETMNVSTSEQYGEKTKTVNAVHNVGDVFQWAVLDTATAMDDAYVDIVFCNYTCRAVGKYCYVWAETHREGNILRIDAENAQKIAAEFDRIYAPMVNNFGTFDKTTTEPKVNILVHNLPTGITSYFYDFEYLNLGNNEEQYFFHLDNYGTMLDVVDDEPVWHVEDGFAPMVGTFAQMLAYVRSQGTNGWFRIPTWLSQVTRQAAINLIYGNKETKKYIESWATDAMRYTNGYSMFTWVRKDMVQSPAYLNVFVEYIRAQCGTYEVFGQLLDFYSANMDDTGSLAFPKAVEGTRLEGMTLGDIVEAYRMALVIKDDRADSLYGFGGNHMFDDIPVLYTSGSGITKLGGGAALLVKNLDSGIFTPSDSASNKIKYVGITIDIDALPTVNCVIFKDYDGTFLKEQLVFSGNDAVPPEDPYHPGMTFTGWDKSYTNIQASVTITATYENVETYYTVTFRNEDDDQYIGEKTVIRSFVLGALEKPVRENYAFIGWYLADGSEFDPVNTKIYSDMTVYARFIPAVEIYAYAFYEWGFTSLSTQDVSKWTVHSEADNNVQWLFAGTYYEGAIYGFNQLKNFVKVNPTTFESEIIALADDNTTVSNMRVAFDMAYDYSTETMYLSYVDNYGTSTLAKVDIATGAVTPIATPSEFYMALACTKDGKLYTMLPDGILATVNKSNGRYSAVGDTGITLRDGDAVTYTCMTIDYNTGRLYWAAENPEDSQQHLYLLDTDTAQPFDLGTTPNNYMLHCLYIPYSFNENTIYTVTFVDWDGTLLSSQQIEAGKDAVAPEDPVREGYRFTGWDKDFTNVQADLRITAQYEKLAEYTVTFVDWNYDVIEKQTVYEGQDAVAPADPIREGYVFIGWDKDFTNVHSDLVVVAQYVAEGEPTPPPSDVTIGDVNGDGKINTADAVVVLKYAAGMVQLDDMQLIAANTNHDDKVNTADAVLILKYSAGMFTEF